MYGNFIGAASALIAALFLAQSPCYSQPPSQAPPVTLQQPTPVDNRDQVVLPQPQVDNRDQWVLPQQMPANPVDSTPTPAEPSTFYDRFWELLSETPPRGFGRTQGAGFGFDQTPVFAPSYRVTWMPDAPVSGQQTNLSAVRQDFRMAIPVWMDECQTFGITMGVTNVLLNTSAFLPGTGQAFPDQLWDVRFGFLYKYVFANGWSAGADVFFGSASNRPFDNVDQLTAGLSAFLRIPVGDHNAWLFSLMYSPTGELNFPIPGVAFYWQPNDWFNATIGIPTKVVWRPVEDVILEAAYMPLTTITARASYRVWGGVYLYAAYNKGNESYFLDNSPDSRDRFFYFDQRVSGGVKVMFGRQCIIDLSSGYAFNRYYFEGVTRNDEQNRVDVGDSPFLSLMMELRF